MGASLPYKQNAHTSIGCDLREQQCEWERECVKVMIASSLLCRESTDAMVCIMLGL